MNIRVVNNGFVLEMRGGEYVAKTLLEAAIVAGEHIPASGYSTYSRTGSKEALRKALNDTEYSKIHAIREIRDMFEPRLGLREAKDLVDLFLER